MNLFWFGATDIDISHDEKMCTEGRVLSDECTLLKRFPFHFKKIEIYMPSNQMCVFCWID